MSSATKIKQLIEQIGSQGLRDGSSAVRGWTYHPIPFPEFNPPVHKISTVDEFRCIKDDYGSFIDKSILDIGCANGYFSFKIALENATRVIGYEGDSLVFDVNEAIKEYKSIQNISFVNRYFDISDAQALVDEEFDVVIMLNVHMWIRKQLGEQATIELMKIMSKKTKTMYFQTAHSSGGDRFQVPELKSLSDIEKYLAGCGFRNVKVLGYNSDYGGGRYMLRCDGAEK